MGNLEDRIAYYVPQLEGPNADNAWHSLVEEGPSAFPLIVRAFESTGDTLTKISLVQIICQYRTEDAIPFLAEQIHNSVPEIWKTALDGLVALGGPKVFEVLGTAREATTAEKREWFDEAICQIHEKQGELTVPMDN